MKRSELIRLLAERFPQLSRADVSVAVEEMLAGVSGALIDGGRVEIRGFGSFSVHYRAPRTGRNPKTGATVEVPGKTVPHFRAGKELRERLEAEWTE
jgi:integration host factor subunit beta